MPFFKLSVSKIFCCCRLASKVENTSPSQSVDLSSLTDETKPDSEASSVSENSVESKTTSSSSCESESSDLSNIPSAEGLTERGSEEEGEPPGHREAARRDANLKEIVSCLKNSKEGREQEFSTYYVPANLDQDSCDGSQDVQERPLLEKVSDLIKEPEEEIRNIATDSTELLPDNSNVSAPSDVDEYYVFELCPLFTVSSSLTEPLLEHLETDCPTELDVRQDPPQATSNPTFSLSNGTRTLARKMAKCFHAQVAKLDEVPVRQLEEMKGEDEENAVLPCCHEEQSCSTEGVAGFSDTVGIEEPPSQTQEVSETVPDHEQEKTTEQKDPDDSTKNLGIFQDPRVFQDPRSRSMTWP